LLCLTGVSVRTVGDIGTITRELPLFDLPMVPLNLETLAIIFPYSVTLAIVGILESLLTATIVDDMTGSGSSKNKEVRGQGIANFVTGFFGGMAGCAMIGQSIINVKSGGLTRLSSFISGGFLILLILLLGDIVAQIPMAALVGVMFMVAIGTFDWHSIKELRKMPIPDALVIIITITIVVITHDLAKGVIAGVLVSATTFVWRIAKIKAGTNIEEGGKKKVYRVSGQLFFGSTTKFGESFTPSEDPGHVIIDMEFAHIWDHSGVIGLAKIINKYENMGKIIRGEEPGPTIVKYVNENNFDVVVMGSRGLNAIQEFVLGSVSHKVAKRANCPVLIVK
jgi:SulP family sulfate permease